MCQMYCYEICQTLSNGAAPPNLREVAHPLAAGVVHQPRLHDVRRRGRAGLRAKPRNKDFKKLYVQNFHDWRLFFEFRKVFCDFPNCVVFSGPINFEEKGQKDGLLFLRI